jgi:actin-related protein 2
LIQNIRGYAFNSTADFEIVRELKEKFCFVSGNPDHDRRLAKLPDGTVVKIGRYLIMYSISNRERFEAPELLFNPAMDGVEGPGVSEIVFDSINVNKICK